MNNKDCPPYDQFFGEDVDLPSHLRFFKLTDEGIAKLNGEENVEDNINSFYVLASIRENTVVKKQTTSKDDDFEEVDILPVFMYSGFIVNGHYFGMSDTIPSIDVKCARKSICQFIFIDSKKRKISPTKKQEIRNQEKRFFYAVQEIALNNVDDEVMAVFHKNFEKIENETKDLIEEK